MHYRRFGRTELSMPIFSCGGMRYQYKWQDLDASNVPSDNQRNLEATIHRAIDLGIFHIETARGYGSSEMQLGQVLPRLPRKKLIVQTKVTPREDSQAFLNTFETSLGYLKLDYVDLLGIHGINNAELLHQTIRPGGCLDVVRKLQAQGKVRFVGFSTHAPTDIILQTIATNHFDYVNLHWYYFYQFNWPAIVAATQHDMGVFIISPSDKGGKLYMPSQKLINLCQPLSPIVFNDLFCLNYPQVHTLSVGAARPEDFDEHLKTLSLLERADEHLSLIRDRLEKAAIEALTPKFQSPSIAEQWFHNWYQGLPRPEETPGHLNLQIILWLWNLTIAYDMVDFAKGRYNLMGNASHWFPGAKVDQVQTLNLKDCLIHSPFADRIPNLLAEAHHLLGGDSVQRLSQF